MTKLDLSFRSFVKDAVVSLRKFGKSFVKNRYTRWFVYGALMFFCGIVLSVKVHPIFISLALFGLLWMSYAGWCDTKVFVAKRKEDC